MNMIQFLENRGRSIAGIWNDIPAGYIYLEIQTYQYNELWHTQWHGFLSNFFSITSPFYLQVRWHAKDIRMYIIAPAKYEEYLTHMFYASFESSELKKTIELDKGWKNNYIKRSRDSAIQEPRFFAEAGSYIDPFRDILSFFYTIPETNTCIYTIQLLFYTPDSLWEKIGKLFTITLKKTDDDEKKVETKKIFISMNFQSTNAWYSDMFLNQLSKFLSQWSVKLSSKYCKIETTSTSVCNFFHLPTKANQNKSLAYIPYRKLPVPIDLPRTNIEEWYTELWYTDYKNSKESFGIRREDKFRHMYVIGKTGMWKSNFLSNLIRSDIHQGWGVAVLDPHGDLIEDILAHIPESRMDDVILFDVSDTDYPVWFNILECTHDHQKNLIASWVVGIFKKLYGNSRGPRLEYILRNVMLSILQYPWCTLLHILRMLTDKKFREEVLTYVMDPIVLKFWRDEFDTRQDRQKNEAIWPIANKIWQFLSSSTVRNIFAQEKSKINIREIMDTWKILLINLSKWRIWEDSASMIWSFLVTKFQIDAMSRADIAEKERKDFYLYIDEFQNFATDSFESILSEARKYRLSLIVANQFTSQIQETVRNAIFGNVWTIIAFGLGYDDASMMSQQFKELITANDLLSLPKYKAYIKLMVDGITKDPFTMWTYPLPESTQPPWTIKTIRKHSREKYAVWREVLEEKIAWWSKKSFSATEKAIEKINKDKKTKKERWEWKNIEDITNIELSKKYTGIVKLKYNYGLFVMVGDVEWLLHKSQIKETWTRKEKYEIWSNIDVIAKEFKEINGDKKIVWTQE